MGKHFLIVIIYLFTYLLADDELDDNLLLNHLMYGLQKH